MFLTLMTVLWAGEDYRIGARDVLEVEVYGEPTLSGSYTVDGQGQLAVPLVGPLVVAGLTTDEVCAELTTRLTPDYLVTASVTVWVKEHGSQPVQVQGAVVRPGVYYLDGDTTVLQILGEAGGVKDGVSEVRITRADNEVTVVAYQDLLTQGGVKVKAGDVIFVPVSLISVTGLVGKPGEVPYREGLTISSALAAVGGVSELGSERRVFILRGDQQIRVNLSEIKAGEAEDLLLEPGDQVFVKRSVL